MVGFDSKKIGGEDALSFSLSVVGLCHLSPCCDEKPQLLLNISQLLCVVAIDLILLMDYVLPCFWIFERSKQSVKRVQQLAC